MDNPEITCYSGHTFAERPVSFSWHSTSHEVEEIEQSWLEPGERCFLVRTRDNKSFKLCYNEVTDKWQITDYKRAKDLIRSKGNAKGNPQDT